MRGVCLERQSMYDQSATPQPSPTTPTLPGLHFVCTAGYKSEGTRHLAGWTNFRAAEADVPDMLVPQDE